MKKNEKVKVNTYIENVVNDINALMRTSDTPIKWVQLYHCTAETGAVGDWILLRSYSTIVAAYNFETDELFDFLRLVYGYTATSEHHIAKFHSFCRSVTGNLRRNGYGGARYRWYQV